MARTRPRWIALLGVVVLASMMAVDGPSAGAAGRAGTPVLLPVPHMSKQVASSYDPRTVLVRFRPGVSPSARERMATRLGLVLGRDVGATGYVVVQTRGVRPRSALRQLRSEPVVADAQLNYLRRAFATPNDPLYNGYQKKYLSNARFTNAWDVTKGSTSKNIAILDTGVDLTHPDLDGARLKAGWDFVNGDDTPQDDNGHGTFVAGTAASITNNGVGVAGGAWKGGIIPVKVLDDLGVGTDADLASGITWAADAGAKVINMSLGGPDDNPVIADAVTYALSKDAVVVAAAGNDGTSLPSYPAAYEGVIAVSATDRSGTFAYFSDYGWWVDLSAPGMFITSTYWDAGQHVYATGHGTSFAAPLVSGAALLARVKYPTWTQSQIVDRLLDTAQDRGPAGVDPYYGRGWLDAYAAVGGAKQAAATVPPKDALEPDGTIDRATVIDKKTVVPTISPEGDEDWFEKVVGTPGSVTFTVTPPGPDPEGDRTKEMDPVLEVYGPDHQLLGTKDDYGVGTYESITVAAMAAGSYDLRVRNYLGSQSPGSYTVTASTSTSFPPIAFEPYDSLDTGGHPEATLIADVTNDGRADLLATTNRQSDPKNTLFLFEQNVDGTLADPVPFATSGSATDDMDMGVGDLNGDGLPDVAVASAGPLGLAGGVDVFYQSGGTLTGPTTYSVSADGEELEVADVDGDLDNDLVVQTVSGLVVLMNTGATFTETAALGTADHQDIAVGDVSGDGLPDVVGVCGVYSTCSSHSVEVFVQQPGGSFGETTYTVNSTGAGVELADLDDDGHTDVAVTVGGNADAALNLLIQNGTGTLDGPTTKDSYDIPVPVAGGDMNGDGLADLVVGHHAWSRIGVYLQKPDGTLQSEDLYTVPYGNDEPTSLSVGDLNGDGVLDIAIADSAEVQVLRQIPDLPGPVLWVRNTSPPDFGTGVSRTKNATITFDRALDPASVTSATAYMRNGNTWKTVTLTVSYDAGTNELTFDKAGNFSAKTPYVIFVDGVTDLDGDPMPLFTFRFTTGS